MQRKRNEKRSQERVTNEIGGNFKSMPEKPNEENVSPRMLRAPHQTGWDMRTGKSTGGKQRPLGTLARVVCEDGGGPYGSKWVQEPTEL